jgi:prepilin-type N-terminal cleavage/methylation domain-containing protein
MTQRGHRWGTPHGDRRGFSLVEIMVVVVIMAIAAGVALPTFVGSFRGAKLRVAARTLTMASRYARSTAVLQSQHMAMLLFTDHSEIELLRLQTRADRSQQAMFMDGRGDRRVDGLLGGDGRGSDAGASGPSLATESVRRLPDGIRIVQVEVGPQLRGSGGMDGAYWISFYPNGMTERFEITLEDDTGRQAVVSIDPISGRVKIEYL